MNNPPRTQQTHPPEPSCGCGAVSAGSAGAACGCEAKGCGCAPSPPRASLDGLVEATRAALAARGLPSEGGPRSLHRRDPVREEAVAQMFADRRRRVEARWRDAWRRPQDTVIYPPKPPTPDAVPHPFRIRAKREAQAAAEPALEANHHGGAVVRFAGNARRERRYKGRSARTGREIGGVAHAERIVAPSVGTPIRPPRPLPGRDEELVPRGRWAERMLPPPPGERLVPDPRYPQITPVVPPNGELIGKVARRPAASGQPIEPVTQPGWQPVPSGAGLPVVSTRPPLVGGFPEPEVTHPSIEVGISVPIYLSAGPFAADPVWQEGDLPLPNQQLSCDYQQLSDCQIYRIDWPVPVGLKGKSILDHVRPVVAEPYSGQTDVARGGVLVYTKVLGTELVTSLEGLDSLEEVSGRLLLGSNEGLTSIHSGLPSLRHVEDLYVGSNPLLAACDVDLLLAQLDPPPSALTLNDLDELAVCE